jgi:hypothetical protein
VNVVHGGRGQLVPVEFGRHRARTLDLDAMQPEKPRQLPGGNAMLGQKVGHRGQQRLAAVLSL